VASFPWRQWNISTSSTSTGMTAWKTNADWVVPDGWGNWNYMWSTGVNTTITNPVPYDWYPTENHVDWMPVYKSYRDVVAAKNWGDWNFVKQRTEDEQRAFEERELIRLAQQAEAMENARIRREQHQAERAAAEARAKELLMTILDAQQKRDVLQFGYFELISNKGKRWRIRLDSIGGNVDLMPDDVNDNVRVASYCAHPPVSSSDPLPAPDHHIAQKLTLEADEESFTNVAYLHHRRRDYDGPIPDRRQNRLLDAAG
jgi:hypothetical protein